LFVLCLFIIIIVKGKDFNTSNNATASNGQATVSRSFSISSAANFLLSPLAKASLNSPKEKLRRKVK